MTEGERVGALFVKQYTHKIDPKRALLDTEFYSAHEKVVREIMHAITENPADSPLYASGILWLISFAAGMHQILEKTNIQLVLADEERGTQRRIKVKQDGIYRKQLIKVYDCFKQQAFELTCVISFAEIQNIVKRGIRKQLDFEKEKVHALRALYYELGKTYSAVMLRFLAGPENALTSKIDCEIDFRMIFNELALDILTPDLAEAKYYCAWSCLSALCKGLIDERGVKEYQYDTHYRKQKMAMLKVCLRSAFEYYILDRDYAYKFVKCSLEESKKLIRDWLN